jgi:hypothetical protein
MALGKMKYRDFKFPYNPETSSFECDRSYVRHKYPELAGNELEDFGPNAVVITGSGEFFGENAYTYWNNLLTAFNKSGVGKFYHPIYKTVTRGLMTKLKSDLEPRENYIKYSFEIVADTDPTTSKASDSAVIEITSKSNDTSSIDVGDIVSFIGTRHYTSSYAGSTSYNCKSGKAKITKMNKSGAHPYHLIHTNGGGSTVYGWVDTSDIDGLLTVKKDTSNKVVHVVVSGECLSKICAYYSKKYNVTISWKDVATYNKIKKPDSIYIGQKITIVW